MDACVRREPVRGGYRGDRLVGQGPAGHFDRNDGLSKKSFEKSRAHFEKLIGVKNVNEAIQLQSDFAKSAYEDFVAEAARIGDLYSDLAKNAFTPVKK